MNPKTIKNKIDKIFQELDKDFESKNLHNNIGCGERIFQSIYKYIPLNNYVKVAEEIARSLRGCI